MSRLLGKGLRQAVLLEGKCFWSAVRKRRETTARGALPLMQGVPTGNRREWFFFFCEKLGLPDSLALPVCQTPGSTRGMSKVLADNPSASSLPLRKSLCFEQWLQHEASAPC